MTDESKKKEINMLGNDDRQKEPKIEILDSVTMEIQGNSFLEEFYNLLLALEDHADNLYYKYSGQCTGSYVKSSWDTHYTYKDVKVSVNSLVDDFRLFVEYGHEDFQDLENTSDFLLEWVAPYQHDDGYGECSAQKIINLKEKLVSLIKEGEVESLKKAKSKVKYWL